SLFSEGTRRGALHGRQPLLSINASQESRSPPKPKISSCPESGAKLGWTFRCPRLRRPMKLLVLTSEPVPLPGLPATGAGLRAWGLTFGLRAAGFPDTTLGFAADSVRGRELAPSPVPGVSTFERGRLAEFIAAEQPD